MRYTAPSFILAKFRVFLRVGLCSRGVLTFSVDVASRGVLDAIKTTDVP